MWNILICDDDKNFLDKLKADILELEDERVKRIELFSDAEQFEFFISEKPNEANIIIMDVRLDSSNGIDLAKQILKLQPSSQIIFISGYDSYYLDVYSVDHVYFLKKPIDTKYLRQAIQRAGEKLLDLHARSFIVSNREGIHIIPYNEILYLENELRKIHVHMVKGKITFYGKFENMMDELDGRFIRCHNSYVVNITKVRKLSSRKFYFDGDRSIPISRTYYDEVRKAFVQYMSTEVCHYE